MIDLIKSLKNMPDFCCFGEANNAEIKAAEKELKLHFSNEYRAYLKEFGFVTYEGHELTGMCKAKRLNVVDVTINQRNNNYNVPKDWYVIEVANIDGIVIWQNKNGEIFKSFPDSKPLKLCDSLNQYVKNDYISSNSF